jgi:hypothetical protein
MPRAFVAHTDSLSQVCSVHCLQLSSADIPRSWHLHSIFLGSPLQLRLYPQQLLASPFQGLPVGTAALSHIAWLPRLSFEIWVEASIIPKLLNSACLQNQRHKNDTKVYCHLEQLLGPLGPWLQ